MAVNEASAAPWGMFGQDAAVAALQQALDSDRLAHAYLFTGPDGVGKGTLARRLVAALLCEAAPDARPCLECRACRRVEAGETPDVERIAIGGVCDEGGPAHRDHAADGSTRIRICQVRRLERVASLTPFQAPRRIFILDTADDLQREAAHALLKTLEEPPSSVLLILLATDVDELLPTVRSRCQELALRPMPDAALIAALTTEDGRLFTIDAAPSGLMLLLRLKPGDSDQEIAANLLAEGIEVQPLSTHYAGRRKEQGLLLSFAGFTERELQRAATKLIAGMKS